MQFSALTFDHSTDTDVGQGIWQLNWGQGPWTWSDNPDQPLLDPNVSGILDIHATAPADVSADLIATLPIAGTLTLSAKDGDYEDVTAGTMVLSGTGIVVHQENEPSFTQTTFICLFSPQGRAGR